jgi:hypothetical protein
MVRKKVLQRRSQRRANVLQDLRDENVRLKKMLALMQRKAEHGCTDANCSLCKEQPGDGTWKLSA